MNLWKNAQIIQFVFLLVFHRGHISVDTQKIFCYQNKDKSSLIGETPANDPYLLIKKKISKYCLKDSYTEKLKIIQMTEFKIFKNLIF